MGVLGGQGFRGLRFRGLGFGVVLKKGVANCKHVCCRVLQGASLVLYRIDKAGEILGIPGTPKPRD